MSSHIGSYSPSTGDPEPEIRFYKDNIRLAPRKLDRRMRIEWDMKADLTVLTIKNAESSDAGAYRLEASNQYGSSSVSVTVTVKLPHEALEEADEGLSVEVVTLPPVPPSKKGIQKVVPQPEPPKIEKAPEPVIVQEGDTIWLSCKIKG